MKRFTPLILLLITSALFAGTTGKIRGRITDANGEPLIGVNVVLTGTGLGAATDVEGAYFVLNVNPGTYTVQVGMIGYKTLVLSNVIVETDLTTELSGVLEISAVAGEVVEVTVTRSLVKKDATASAVVISGAVFASAPIESFEEIVKTKAGVTVDPAGALHIRGGRADEILYLVDGVPNVNPFSNVAGVDVATNAIQELSVITGSFSAEYGHAMSGVINIITKEGSSKYHGSMSYMAGDLWTDYDLDVSPKVQGEVNPYELGFSNEIEASISGPVISNLNFQISIRRYNDGGYQYGVSRYNAYGAEKDSADWTPFVQNPAKKTNWQAKLAYKLTSNIKLIYTFLSEDNWWQSYSHTRKYIEDGHTQYNKDARTHILKLTQQINNSSFYDLSFSNIQNDYRSYAYANETDAQLVADDYYVTDANYEFYTGGTVNDRETRLLKTTLVKMIYMNQLNNQHELKSGFEAKFHDLYLHTSYMAVDQRAEPFEDADNDGEYTAGEVFTDLDGDGSWDAADDENGDGIDGNIIRAGGGFDIESHPKPSEFSFFIKDKIELQDMVLDIGVRWDYFDTKGSIAADWTNPNPDSTIAVKAKQQFSPRFSIGYPVSDRGKLFFSYGHFFQMAPYQRVYHNADFEVLAGVIKSDIGNADLEPQKTISYEVGFEHEVGYDAAVFVKLFYRDIRNLLGQRIYILPGGNSYALFINRDWGSTRGFSFSFEKRLSNLLSGSLDYTYMVAKGNESDPTRTRRDYRLAIEPQKKIVYLSWDQSHAFRFNLNLALPGSWSISSIGRFESGYPYTPTDANALIRVAEEYSGRKPRQIHFDMTAFKHFMVSAGSNQLQLTLFAKLYNVFDIRNENYVHDNSGSARYSLGRYGDDSTPEYINRANYYSKPRELNIGISVSF